MTKAERNAEIVRRHQEGASLRCIAAEVGLSYEGVRLILNAAGFGKAKDPIDVAAAWRLYQHGWSMEAIGKRLHADAMTVCRAFQRHGLPARPRGRPHTPPSVKGA